MIRTACIASYSRTDTRTNNWIYIRTDPRTNTRTYPRTDTRTGTRTDTRDIFRTDTRTGLILELILGSIILGPILEPIILRPILGPILGPIFGPIILELIIGLMVGLTQLHETHVRVDGLRLPLARPTLLRGADAVVEGVLRRVVGWDREGAEHVTERELVRHRRVVVGVTVDDAVS